MNLMMTVFMKIIRFLMGAIILIFVFSVCFFAVTIVCDVICKHTNYYEQAALEGFVLDD